MKLFTKIIMLGLGLALFTTACKKNDFISGPELKSEGLAEIPGVAALNGPWVITGQDATWGGNHFPFLSGALPSSLIFPGSSSGTPARSYYAVGGRSMEGYFWTLGKLNDPFAPDFGQRGIHRFEALTSAVSSVAFKPIGPASLKINNQQSEVNFHIYDGTVGYYTDVESAPGKITSFKPLDASMTDIITWDLTNALASNFTLKNRGYNNATLKHLGGKLLIRRGNTIYADVTFGNSYNILKQVVQSTNRIYIAAIDAISGNLKTVSSVRGATNIGLFNDHPLVNQDPVSNRIYFSAVGDMNKTGSPAKIFRINNGSDQIDPFFVRNYTFFGSVGQFNTLYAYRDYLYVKHSAEDTKYDHSPTSTYRTDIWQWAVINPEGIKKNLDIPIDNFYTYQHPRLINGEIYFIYNNKTGSGIHKVAPINATSWAAATPLATTAVSTLDAASAPIIRIAGIDKIQQQ